MSKAELLNGLNCVLNSFLYGLMCSRLVSPETWRSASTGSMIFEGPQNYLRIHLKPLSDRLLDPANHDRFIRNYENTLVRALLRETHELLLQYCKETDQFTKYKSEPWFQFARIMRNVVSHKNGGVLREWPKDLHERGVAAVRWQSRTLDAGMLGKALTFYPYEALRLVKDQADFAESKLA